MVRLDVSFNQQTRHRCSHRYILHVLDKQHVNTLYYKVHTICSSYIFKFLLHCGKMFDESHTPTEANGQLMLVLYGGSPDSNAVRVSGWTSAMVGCMSFATNVATFI